MAGKDYSDLTEAIDVVARELMDVLNLKGPLMTDYEYHLALDLETFFRKKRALAK
jgi:hypothetical protein